MRVLVLNCGSSSLKWRLFDQLTAVSGGLVERVTARRMLPGIAQAA